MKIGFIRSGFIAFLVLTICLIIGNDVYAEQLPNPIITDNRISQVVYSPNEVYVIVGVYNYQTSIEFGADEVVKLLTIGDSIAWQPVSFQNRIFLKPVEPNASTNLTVLTDKRAYYFHLRSTRAPRLATYLVRFIYPERNMYIESGGASAGQAKGFDPTTLNFDYQVSGDRKAIAVKKIFDDGKFTYFVFDEGSEIPAIYTVMADKTDSLVNTHREGEMLVVERLSEKFTLRLGDSYLCVRQKKKNQNKTTTRIN